MSDDEPGGVFNIQSRIKQFSSNAVDDNANLTQLKPNPMPRRRHHTEKLISAPFQRSNVSRSSSSPVNQEKPIIPAKPQPAIRSPGGLNSPSPQPRPGNATPPPKSPKPPAKKRPDIRDVNTCNNKIADIKNNNEARTTFYNNNIEHIKPKPPVKPDNLDRPMQGASIAQPKFFTSDQVSWKKTAGPPKIPVPVGPSLSVADIANPPKPPRGKDRSSRLEYENQDIAPYNSRSSLQEESVEGQRRETLDGQLVLGPTKNVLSSTCKTLLICIISNFL